MHEEDIRSGEIIPDTDDDEQDFEEIKDPRQAQDAAATADAVNKVLEEFIQSSASKKICVVSNLLIMASPVPLQAPPHDKVKHNSSVMCLILHHIFILYHFSH
ncbi:hypothetical protein MtrunA17_Chr1g0151441 [Medicago truncatula]|uniref:Uncharacterized protein n=1 Tax=Medicago truncatula TaxID=3880 RepID=A0A396JLD1_MEDTR|nr:hypothetical protein MtrunA17_Chr1g0151441 [Medicago truncatula]